MFPVTIGKKEFLYCIILLILKPSLNICPSYVFNELLLNNENIKHVLDVKCRIRIGITAQRITSIPIKKKPSSKLIEDGFLKGKNYNTLII